MIRKAVVPAAGLGTRLLSATKEQPKEMLPIFAADNDGALCLKPMLQQIFEQIFDFGLREFYFVVGRGKRAIVDHFIPDREFVQRLNANGKSSQAFQLQSFYEKIEASAIAWVNQPEPKGFGDAVLEANRVVGKEPFLVHAGDTYIIPGNQDILAKLTETHARGQAEVTLTLKEVHDPRMYGVAEVTETGAQSLLVNRVTEKPSHPASKLAIMPVYVFNSTIFQAIRNTPPGRGGEIQLTDAIQKLIDDGRKVQAIKLSANDIRLDIGTPETYREALELSYQDALAKKTNPMLRSAEDT